MTYRELLSRDVSTNADTALPVAALYVNAESYLRDDMKGYKLRCPASLTVARRGFLEKLINTAVVAPTEKPQDVDSANDLLANKKEYTDQFSHLLDGNKTELFDSEYRYFRMSGVVKQQTFELWNLGQAMGVVLSIPTHQQVEAFVVEKWHSAQEDETVRRLPQPDQYCWAAKQALAHALDYVQPVSEYC